MRVGEVEEGGGGGGGGGDREVGGVETEEGVGEVEKEGARGVEGGGFGRRIGRMRWRIGRRRNGRKRTEKRNIKFQYYY